VPMVFSGKPKAGPKFPIFTKIFSLTA